MMQTRRRLLAALASSVVMCVSGCTTFSGSNQATQDSWLDRMPWKSDRNGTPEPYPNPVKLAATWTADNLVQAGRTPTRGFGGRVFFYNEKSQPVPVDGMLVVHGFDETATDPSQQVKRFVFTPEQLTGHFSRSDLGASYSVWIPWDAVGGEQKKISLVATFRSATGKTIQGIPAVVLLPGRRPDQEAQFADKLSPQYRRWQQVAAGDTPRSTGLTTTTITRPGQRQSTGFPEGDRFAPPQSSPSMMAGKTETPAVEVPMARPRESVFIPASARLPAAK